MPETCRHFPSEYYEGVAYIFNNWATDDNFRVFQDAICAVLVAENVFTEDGLVSVRITELSFIGKDMHDIYKIYSVI